MVIPEEAFVNMLYKSSVQLYNFYRRFLCMLHYVQITFHIKEAHRLCLRALCLLRVGRHPPGTAGELHIYLCQIAILISKGPIQKQIQ